MCDINRNAINYCLVGYVTDTGYIFGGRLVRVLGRQFGVNWSLDKGHGVQRAN